VRLEAIISSDQKAAAEAWADAVPLMAPDVMPFSNCSSVTSPGLQLAALVAHAAADVAGTGE